MADRSLVVQKAVVAALKGASAVSNIVGARVYDGVPHSPEYPLVQVSIDVSQPYDGTGDWRSWECVIRVDSWARKRGSSVAAVALAAACNDTLHRQSLTLDSGTHVQTLHIAQRTVRDDDQETVHVQTRYRVVVDS